MPASSSTIGISMRRGEMTIAERRARHGGRQDRQLDEVLEELGIALGSSDSELLAAQVLGRAGGVVQREQRVAGDQGVDASTHTSGPLAASAAKRNRWRHVAFQATQTQYIAARNHASGRSIPASASRISTGTPRRGRVASSVAAHTTSAMYGMSM